MRGYTPKVTVSTIALNSYSLHRKNNLVIIQRFESIFISVKHCQSFPVLCCKVWKISLFRIKEFRIKLFAELLQAGIVYHTRTYTFIVYFQISQLQQRSKTFKNLQILGE